VVLAAVLVAVAPVVVDVRSLTEDLAVVDRRFRKTAHV